MTILSVLLVAFNTVTVNLPKLNKDEMKIQILLISIRNVSVGNVNLMKSRCLETFAVKDR